MLKKFSVGDKVRLKSGGPVMTIALTGVPSGLAMSPSETNYGCQWFAVSHYAELKTGKSKEMIPVFCNEPQYRSFPGDALELVK